MNYEKIVYPSTQLYSNLPDFITEQYPSFVEFMQRSLESNERQGFGQDILQNLSRYRDFEYYKAPIIEFGILDDNLTIDEEESLLLTNSYGFPDENGVVYIGEEVILYRRREGNRLFDLTRGASATTDLGTFVKNSTYSYTEADKHFKGDRVVNLSVLFLQSMLDTIHDTFAYGIDSKWIHDQVNHGQLLERFRDFFQAKGTKLGIKALFKFLFAENDVDVFYPGDQMIVASESTWIETFIMRSVPVPELLVDPTQLYILPDRLINREAVLKSYNDQLDEARKDVVYGRAIVDYVSSYNINDETQYEAYVQKQNVTGNFVANPFTNLTRDIYVFGTGYDNRDVTTITVESTLGFPERGLIFIDGEGIFYERKTFNQFLNCQRGFINVEANHRRDTRVYGPYYVEGKLEATDDRGRSTELISRSWPLGLVSHVDIEDPGLLHLETDEIYPNGPGRVDPREPMIASFHENYDDDLINQAQTMPYMADHTDRTAGVSGVFFDSEYVYVTSTNFPYHQVGNFSVDYTVGPDMEAVNGLHVLPRRTNIKENKVLEGDEYYFHDKGVDTIGVAINGVPFFSNQSPQRLMQGRITEYKVTSGGQDYLNPTLLVDDVPVPETIELNPNIGTVVSITATDERNYNPTEDNKLPTVEVTGGKGAVVSVEFDKYGRCIKAVITEPGQYYIDTPKLALMDPTLKGKGAALECTVENGGLATVTIVNTGIDYNALATVCNVYSRGTNSQVIPVVQYYQFDRYAQVENNRNWSFDPGGGFLWEHGVVSADKRFYGYIGYPFLLAPDLTLFANINTELKERLKTSDTEDYIIANPRGAAAEHSPLLGWAWDGNPIYGNTVYENGVDASNGFKIMQSGYVLLGSRAETIPSGGDSVATLPPSEQLYPMGTFVEDYVFDASAVTRATRIMSEDFERIMTETEDYILATTPLPQEWVLNKNNAVKCNTPEFPAELYPDGVWCYIATTKAGRPQFPYLIGKTFEQRPLSQNIALSISEQNQPDPIVAPFIIFNPESKNRENPIVFDYEKVERYRNLYLTPTKAELELRVEHTSTGSISDIVVVDGKPVTSKVGDFLYFEDTGTQGAGASGIVSELNGVDINKGVGSDITTTVISHYQRLSLRGTGEPELDADGVPIGYSFVEGSIITTTSGAEAVVLAFDTTMQILDVYTYTKNLIQPGDSFRDERNVWITLGTADNTTVAQSQAFGLDTGFSKVLNVAEQRQFFHSNNADVVGRNMYFAAATPEGGAQPGDLWWSDANGRLYIYFNDGDSGQWVCTQPIGMRPLAGASDTPIGNTSEASKYEAVAIDDLVVIIADKAPDTRSSGGPIQPGDMWWSSHTGVMYIYIDQWICTDPNATVPTPDAADVTNAELKDLAIPDPYETKQYVIISYIAPTGLPFGGLITDGVLWWSPLTGKMYIYYTSPQKISQWVVTNPLGILSSAYSLDYIPEGDGGAILPPVTPGPIPPGDGENIGPIKLNKGESVIWFEDLIDFIPGDEILMGGGAPGTGHVETGVIVKIVEPGAPTAAIIRRTSSEFEIPDGANVLNTTRSRYIVTTREDHNLRKGDLVTIEGSKYDEINATHEVIRAGVVDTAEGITTVSNGQVVSVTVTNPGKGYTSNFYVTFYGGGGTGGYAYAEVDETTTGIKRVVVLDGGINYTESPKIYWGTVLTTKEFQIYLSETYDEEKGVNIIRSEGLKYHTSSTNVVSSIHSIDVASPGIGYKRLPVPMGIYKKAIDRGEFRVNLSGTVISDVEVLSPGSRYEYPVAVFYDRMRTGSGATGKVNVVEGKVESIEVIDGGLDYTEPAILLVEDAGKYIALTNDIGKIESISVLNPGRAISPDRSLKPEVMIETKCIVEFDTYTAGVLLSWDGVQFFDPLASPDNYPANSVFTTGQEVSEFSDMTPGDLVWQGTADGTTKQVTATYVSYDNATQIITLKDVYGVLKDGEYLYNEAGKKGMVLREGQADCRVVVRGISSPEGRFVDDTSIISSSYAHLQDSYYYQHFSYSITSPLQQKQFDEFVSAIIHPAGFIMFSDLQVRSEMTAPFKVNEAIISGPVYSILSPDDYNVEYTAIGSGETENTAISPDTGTLEL